MSKELFLVLDGDKPQVFEINGENLVGVGDTINPHCHPRHLHFTVLKKLQKQAADFEKWFLTICCQSDFLNLKNASPVVEGGKVVSLEFCRKGDDEPYEPSPADYERLGLDPDNLGCVEPHPEGADRGGYVPMLSNGCHYCECACEWQGD